MRMCPRCKIEKDVEEFYQRRGVPGKSVYCKPCTNNQTLERQRKFKKLCIEYKGGSCSRCGYNKCDAAMDFHHLDRKEKKFNIANARLTSFSEVIKNELDKCILVCANCHRELEDEIVARRGIAPLLWS